MVDLAKPDVDAGAAADVDDRETDPADAPGEDVPNDRNHAQVHGEQVSAPPAVPEKVPPAPKSVEPALSGKDNTDPATRTSEPAPVPQPAASRHSASATEVPPPLRTADEFLASKSEKLSYLITLLGVPVGSVELEAKNENNEIRIIGIDDDAIHARLCFPA